MKTKVLAFSLVVIFVVSLVTIPVNIYAAEENGEILRELGILQGDLNGDLLLDQPLKRQDGIVLLSRLLLEEELASNYDGISSFTDISDPYYESYIAWAEDRGLTEGIGGGLFGYNQPLTHQQLLTFLLRALGYDFYGDQFFKVPEAAVELLLTDSLADMNQTATREFMADVTVNTLRRGRVKYGNITLERSLAIGDDRVDSDSQLFQLKTISARNGYLLLFFDFPSLTEDSETDKLLNMVLKEGPNIDDLKVTYRLQGEEDFNEVQVKKALYDYNTGQLVVTFDPLDIGDTEIVEIRVNRLELRSEVAHEAAHVLQQRGGVTKSESEIDEIINRVIDLTLQPFIGSFTGEQLNGGSLLPLTKESSNPLYESSILSGESVLYENENNSDSILSSITLSPSIIKPNLDNFFVHVYLDDQLLICDDCISKELIGNTVNTNLRGIEKADIKRINMFFSYFNNDGLFEMIESEYSLNSEQSREIVSSILIGLQGTLSNNATTSISSFGNLTINQFEISAREKITIAVETVIVKTYREGNGLKENEIIGLVLNEKGVYVEETFTLYDYGNDFYDEFSANNTLLSQISNSNGLKFLYKGKPIKITKEIDKSTPLLMSADGSIGDTVMLHISNGKVMFWDGPDNDCDGIDDDCNRQVGVEDCDDGNVHILNTTTYYDKVTIDFENQTLRVGRNPQTGATIKITDSSIFYLDDDDDGDTIPNDTLRVEYGDEPTFEYAKIVTDEENNVLFVHLFNNYEVFIIDEINEGDKIIKVIYTNSTSLTDEDIDYLLENGVKGDKFIVREEFGQVSGISTRSFGQLHELINYTNNEGTAKKVAKFKAGKALADTVKSVSDTSTCSSIVMGNNIDFSTGLVIDEADFLSARAILYVDENLPVFKDDNKKYEFRGHVTVLK